MKNAFYTVPVAQRPAVVAEVLKHCAMPVNSALQAKVAKQRLEIVRLTKYGRMNWQRVKELEQAVAMVSEANANLANQLVNTQAALAESRKEVDRLSGITEAYSNGSRGEG